MMKLFELTDNISDEERLARMNALLDEMITLTENLEENNDRHPEYRIEDKKVV